MFMKYACKQYCFVLNSNPLTSILAATKKEVLYAEKKFCLASIISKNLSDKKFVIFTYNVNASKQSLA